MRRVYLIKAYEWAADKNLLWKLRCRVRTDSWAPVAHSLYRRLDFALQTSATSARSMHINTYHTHYDL